MFCWVRLRVASVQGEQDNAAPRRRSRSDRPWFLLTGRLNTRDGAPPGDKPKSTTARASPAPPGGSCTLTAHGDPRRATRSSPRRQALRPQIHPPPDIRDRDTLHANFRRHFEALNRVTLTDAEFARLLDDIITPDVFDAATRLRERSSFVRDDPHGGTPLNYTLVNNRDWCKNTFEVVSQLKINTTNSHHRYDVMLLVNGLPAVQIELKSLGISPRRAMQQIVDYKSDPGNGYTNSLLCFVQLFIVSNRDRTFYFTNNNKKHFAFNAEGKCWVKNHAHVLKPTGMVAKLLIAYLTLIDIGGFVTGAAPPKLTLAGLKKISIPVPPVVAEQRRIASCLGSLDALLSAQAQELAALRRHKRGLMQQLFPSPTS